MVQEQQQPVQLQYFRAAVAGSQRSGGGGKTHHPYHRAAGLQGLHSVVDALPGQAADGTVHGQARPLLPGTHRAGGRRAKCAVHRHGGHIAVIGRQPPQVELHGPHSGAAAALAHRGGELAGRYTVVHNFVGHGQGDFL